jgi:hypothetical protein
MRSKTQFITYTLLLGTYVSSGLAQQPVKDQTPPKQAVGAQAGSVPETETILPSQLAQTHQPVNAPGFMDPVQVKALAHKIWVTEFRINDLLTQLHPEKWKASNITRNSFNQMLENLHRTLEGLEEWRAQFEKRPDSMYFGFQTYAAMNAALPRLDGVARAASQFENSSLAAQYSQAGNQLFDLQQALQPYVAYLLRNSDQLFYVAQTNLAGCQNELGNALRGQGGRATPLKNTFVEFHARRPSDGQPKDRTSAGSGKQKSRSKTEKEVESKSRPHKVPSPQ